MAQWTTGAYGTERLDLGVITISVSYAMVERGAPTGYQYRYGSFTSKKLYATSDEAKAAGIESLDVRLAAARREIAEIRSEKYQAFEPPACEYCGMVHAPHGNSLCNH